jgi:anthranilate synthase component 1
MQFRPNRDEFRRLAERGNTIPVYTQLLADHLTPVTAFARLSENSPTAFLLESVVGGEKIARYSFLAADPSVVFSAVRNRVTISRGDRTEEFEAADPLSALEETLRDRKAAPVDGLPPFVGGLVGYAGYDLARYYEPLPDAPPDDRNLPDILFGLYERMVMFDHVDKTIKLVANAHVADDDVDRCYDAATEQVAELARLLAQPGATDVGHISLAETEPPPFESNFEPGKYEQAVEACKEYIRAGDIFQVVLSQRLSVRTQAHPFDIYRALRVINPSPFMFYMKCPHCVLVGASPEIMCKVEDGVVTNRPLAGTRRRGRTEAEDLTLEEDLLADPKERAEHIMLVDLGRNDVGRVAEAGSVELTDVMSIERYSHVMHISSNVNGKLAADMTSFDALRAALPVGTVSGAPKVRAMQIIDEFEPTRRGPYAGAVGYVDFSGNLETCIALRTIVLLDDRADLQVGAGIVADSVPANEYQETINKAQGMLKAIRVAERGFGLDD